VRSRRTDAAAAAPSERGTVGGVAQLDRSIDDFSSHTLRGAREERMREEVGRREFELGKTVALTSFTRCDLLARIRAA